MEQALKDQTVIVTGGARGIGLAHASYFATQGAKVVIADSGCHIDGSGEDPSIAIKAAREIGRRGGAALACAVDVCTERAFETVMQQTQARFGAVHAIVLNAGVNHHQNLRGMTEAHARLALRYLEAALRWTSQALSHWSQRQQSGCLLLTTSNRAWTGRAQQAHLSALDAGVVALVKSAALELGNCGLRINAIAPSAYTRQTADSAEFRSIDPLALDPALTAPLAAFLISKHAMDINGEVLGVEGRRWFSYRTLQTPGVFTETTVNFSDMASLIPKALRQS